MRIIFMGTPEFSVPTLTELVARGHDVCAVYTQPPRPAGRGQGERKSPVHEAAEGFGIEVRTPDNFKAEQDREAFAALDADVAVVVAYGLLLPEAVLNAPEYGCLNLHASLLPRWRGAAPIQRAIMAGDTETGIMVMRMEKGLDTGPVGLIERVSITPEMTAGELHDQLMVLGADMMGRALAALERGGLSFTAQVEDGATYAKKIDKTETRIDFAQPADAVRAHINGLSPFPGAWFEAEGDKGGKPQRIKALRAVTVDGNGEPGAVIDAEGVTVCCGEGAVRITELQRAGSKPMQASEFARGLRIAKVVS
ncbi:methionyl-tRNA formyltransferase [Cucumibacter marinus]|uniref:methionyl-tRNA formyltransferase n=1 Tax=Cucumibacter marinus TaxID=1121252 RepID=UPI000400709F|nr:methionyl-tRNA formyltransferase [Cucumibacter marinus]